jgi:hypothetical protein
MANRRAVPPRTSKERSEKLPQFEPDYSIPYHQIKFARGERRLFPVKRERRLRKVLTEFIGSHSRSADWCDKPTSADRFVENALRAIAAFEYRRSAQPSFDRKAARILLKRTGDRILDTCQDLEEISTNRELSLFLKKFYAAADRENAEALEASERNLSAALKQSEARSRFYRETSPQEVACRLMQLHALLAAAAEKVELAPGDFQRDELAQELCNELAIAWISETGKIPTVSEPSKAHRTNSPFLSLLTLVNENIDQKFQHQNDFRNYGANARDEMRRLFPDLVSKIRKRRGRN